MGISPERTPGEIPKKELLEVSSEGTLVEVPRRNSWRYLQEDLLEKFQKGIPEAIPSEYHWDTWEILEDGRILKGNSWQNLQSEFLAESPWKFLVESQEGVPNGIIKENP